MLDSTERMPLAGVLAIKLGAVLHPDSGPGGEAWKGDLLFALAALMWTLYTVLTRRWNTPPLAVVAVVQVGGLLYVPFYFLAEGTGFLRAAPLAIATQAVYLGIVVSVVSVFLFNLAVRQLGARASMFTALMPVVGVSLAVLLLGEPASPSLALGTVLIVGGLFLSLRK